MVEEVVLVYGAGVPVDKPSLSATSNTSYPFRFALAIDGPVRLLARSLAPITLLATAVTSEPLSVIVEESDESYHPTRLARSLGTNPPLGKNNHLLIA
tara:strand:- start:175 stop:468 length:294 start_codon:yes stop_codon:yes gene_type:complete